MGRFVKGSLKVICALLLVAAAGFYVVVNHSLIRQDFVCNGHWKDAPSESETAYVQLYEYRWWVHLYSNSRGYVKMQTDKRALSDYIPEVIRIHDGRLALYSFHEYDFKADKVGKFRGGYRAANNEITIEFLPDAVFIGKCDGGVRS